MTPQKRFSKMIFLNAKNSGNALLAEPHGAVRFSCRSLTFSAKVSCRTLEIAEPTARVKIITGSLVTLEN